MPAAGLLDAQIEQADPIGSLYYNLWSSNPINRGLEVPKHRTKAAGSINTASTQRTIATLSKAKVYSCGRLNASQDALSRRV